MKTEVMIHSILSSPVKTILLSLFAFSAQAGLVVTNGGFEETTLSGSGLVTNSNLTGWQTTSGYTFLVAPGDAGINLGTGISLWDSNTNGGLDPIPGASPLGGNFIVSDGAYEMGELYQTLTGLVAGRQYDVTFYQAAGQQYTFTGDTQEEWQVTLGGTLTSGQSVTLENAQTATNITTITGGQTQTSALMSNPSHGFTNWEQQTLQFTATSSSELLGFLAVGSPLGQPPFVLLDGVTVEAIPEPETLLLLGEGLLSMVAAGRRQMKHKV
ncbi:MAG: PEP-CTERM sorting domain-containing protein [Methylococcales bacterium]|nr:PEP-CTERM sorting domain-containing protein [Methylococcales bacterium]